MTSNIPPQQSSFGRVVHIDPRYSDLINTAPIVARPTSNGHLSQQTMGRALRPLVTDSPAAPAADHAHLCDHPADAMADTGCPRWPACLSLDAPPVLQLRPLTDAEADALIERWQSTARQQVARVFAVPDVLVE